MRPLSPFEAGALGRLAPSPSLAASDRHHVVAFRGRTVAIVRPCDHRRPPLGEKITTGIRRFGPVIEAMGQRMLHDLAGEGGFLARPIAERTSKTVRDDRRAFPACASCANDGAGFFVRRPWLPQRTAARCYFSRRIILAWGPCTYVAR
jgi:hypothetical protein